MGMNYYAIRTAKIAELEQKKQASLKETEGLKGIIPIVTEYFDEKINSIVPVHIGKSSAGWEFLFNLNEKNYYTDKASLIDFLSQCRIEDEYGIEYSLDAFWNNVVSDRTFNGKPAKKNESGYSTVFTIDELQFLNCEFC